MSSANLSKLFAVPSQPLSPSFPLRLPGITEESGKALVETLKEDYVKYHVFFDTVGRHNHTAHHLVTLYTLGADNALIRAGLKENAKIQMPAFDSPGSINERNVFDHLGESKYYQGYLRFFVDQVSAKGIAAVLEEFIFSDKANIGSAEGQKQPHMLARFLSSVLHPMIQTGYGCELNMLGLVAEGLAQTAVHYSEDCVLLPPSVFESTTSGKGISSALDSLSLIGKETTSHSHGVHALTILASAFEDPIFAPITPDHHGDIPELRGSDERSKARLARIRELSEQWAKHIDCSKPGALDTKIQELAFMNTLIYVMRGTHAGDGKPFYADFFLAHLVTSSVFLSPIAHFLTPASQTRFLQAYFATCISWYVVRGRRNSDISNLFNTPMPAVPSKVSLARGALTTEHDGTPWLALIKSGIAHPEAHVSKIIRALAHWANHYGDRTAGHLAALAEGPDGLKGADKIDGTLFIRAALLNTSKLGWVGEGEPVGSWDIFFTGFQGPPPPPMIKE